MKRAYFIAVQILLVLVATGKFIGAAKWQFDSPLMDPILKFISAKQMLVLSGIMELAVAVFIWRAGSNLKKAVGVLWLSLLFMVYRFALWQTGSHEHCKCLGYWGDWMNLSEKQGDIIAQLVLAVMFLGSTAIIILEMRKRRKSALRTAQSD